MKMRLPLTRILLLLLVLSTTGLAVQTFRVVSLGDQYEDLFRQYEDLQSQFNILQQNYQSAQFRSSSLESDLQRLQQINSGLDLELRQLRIQVSNLQSEIQSLQLDNTRMESEVQRLQAELAHPTLTIWTSCGGPCTMSANSWRAGGVPDTFEYWIEFAATTPVAVYFLGLYQYVQFRNCSGSPLQKLSCVGEYRYFPSTTSRTNSVFRAGTDCASWIAVYISTGEGVIYPNIKVRYNPSNSGIDCPSV